MRPSSPQRRLLNETQQIRPTDIQRDVRKTPRFPTTGSNERGWVSKVGGGVEQFSGQKEKVDIRLKGQEQYEGFIHHTHPVKGQATPLGSLPSTQDLQTAVQVATGPHGIAQAVGEGGIKGIVIWHGQYYTAVVPTDKMKNLSVQNYDKALQVGDFEGAIAALQHMGFIVDHGTR
jgi:hypothetical protein